MGLSCVAYLGKGPWREVFRGLPKCQLGKNELEVNAEPSTGRRRLVTEIKLLA